MLPCYMYTHTLVFFGIGFKRHKLFWPYAQNYQHLYTYMYELYTYMYELYTYFSGL